MTLPVTSGRRWRLPSLLFERKGKLLCNAMRPEQVLPDSVDQIQIRGATIRKGTVAAFLASARVWSDSEASEQARAEASADMLEALPALRAVGLFDVPEIRDISLREWLGKH